MSQDPKARSLPKALLAEIADELFTLEGVELDNFLREIGEDPDLLAQHHAAALQTAISIQGRQRFEDARLRLKAGKSLNTEKLFSLDAARKRELLEAIRVRGEQTGDMTMAARNRTVASEADINSLLEACLRLGVIDEDGSFKD